MTLKQQQMIKCPLTLFITSTIHNI